MFSDPPSPTTLCGIQKKNVPPQKQPPLPTLLPPHVGILDTQHWKQRNQKERETERETKKRKAEKLKEGKGLVYTLRDISAEAVYILPFFIRDILRLFLLLLLLLLSE